MRCFFQSGPSKPEDADPVAVGGEEVGLAVAIEIAGEDVGGSGFVLGDGDSGPGLLCFFGSGVFPIGEPVAVLEGFSFGGDGDFAPAVSVEIAEAEVVAAAAGVSFRKEVSIPLGGVFDRLWNGEPGDGVSQGAFGEKVVDDDVEAAVFVDVGFEEAVDAADVGVDETGGPGGRWCCCRGFRARRVCRRRGSPASRGRHHSSTSKLSLWMHWPVPPGREWMRVSFQSGAVKRLT